MSSPDPASAAFRAAMGRWATGVSIVTAHEDGRDIGLTVNALLSVSLAPPSLLVSLQRDADTLPVIHRTRSFGVSLLSAEQRLLSARFARAIPPEEKFREVRFHRGTTGTALLDDALAVLECRVVSEAPSFDHVLIVGEVVRLEEGRDRLPLLFYRGAYADVEPDGRLRLGHRAP
jgi:flavin reductase (DIM6/NTAB) family NADH-FMN oxidoreductase RutF